MAWEVSDWVAAKPALPNAGAALEAALAAGGEEDCRAEREKTKPLGRKREEEKSLRDAPSREGINQRPDERVQPARERAVAGEGEGLGRTTSLKGCLDYPGRDEISIDLRSCSGNEAPR